MAYTFSAGSSQSITTSSSPVTAVPFTLACWGKRNYTSGDHVQFGIYDNTAGFWDSGHAFLKIVSDGTISAFFENVSADSTTTLANNTWGHICGVFPSTNSRQVFLNGGSKGTHNGNKALASINSISFGSLNKSSPSDFHTGDIAEGAIWNVALTDAEIAYLGAGYSPLFIRPQNLVFYAPIIRGLIDRKGGLTLTNNNSATVGDHPRVIYPYSARNSFPIPAVGGGLSIPVAMRSYRKRRVHV